MGSANATVPRLQRVLIADDEHLVIDGLKRCLADLACTITAACKNGEDAVQACRDDRPDLALLDIQMPRMNGLEAARVIYGEMGVPVIIVSAFSDSQYIRTGADVGVYGYLLKPVTREDIEAVMTVAWARFNESRGTQKEITQLHQRLEDRKMIERAKWILVNRLQVSEECAMKRLQKQARDARRTLADVARCILENADLIDPGRALGH